MVISLHVKKPEGRQVLAITDSTAEAAQIRRYTVNHLYDRHSLIHLYIHTHTHTKETWHS